MYYSGENYQQRVFEDNSDFSITCNGSELYSKKFGGTARLATEGLTPVVGLVRINKWALSLLIVSFVAHQQIELTFSPLIMKSDEMQNKNYCRIVTGKLEIIAKSLIGKVIEL